MVDPRLYCGSCQNCASSSTHACHQWGFRGLSGGGGGLSETVAVDASMCYALPDSVPLEIAALIEPLTVAYHALTVSGIKDFNDRSVLILGGGPVGIAVIMCLRAQGVGTVIVSEPTLKRREQNAAFADAVLDPLNESVGDRCREMTVGNGVDVVFDCAGIQPGLNAGMDALVFRGTYVNVAGWEKPVGNLRSICCIALTSSSLWCLLCTSCARRSPSRVLSRTRMMTFEASLICSKQVRDVRKPGTLEMTKSFLRHVQGP